MKREPTYREKLRGTYHYVLTVIARHLGAMAPDAKPTKAHLVVIKDYYRARFHMDRSTEDLSDSEFSDLIWTVESDAADRAGVSFPERRTRDAARATAATTGERA